jgi:hypothetical protein
MASVISFFILLLATYSYSAPIGQEYGNSTAEYEYTTSPIIVEHVSFVNMHLISDDESTSIPTIQNSRSSEESNSDEVTTDYVTRSTRADTETEKKRNDDESLYPPSNNKRIAEDFLYTTLESSNEFNQRAIRPVEFQEVPESSTAYSENQMEITTNVQPSSSVDSFGKYTGLLNYEQSSTSQYEPTDQSSEELTTQFPFKTQQLTTIVSIIPGKVTQTKIFANPPSKTSVLIQPVEQEQLSQVPSESIFQKRIPKI